MPDKVLTLNPYTGGVFDGNNSWVELEEPAPEVDPDPVDPDPENPGNTDPDPENPDSTDPDLDPVDPVDNVPGE